MSLKETIRDVVSVNLGADDVDVALSVAEQFRSLNDYREATWPLLVDEVRRIRREDDRGLEAGARRWVEGEGQEADPAADRVRYLAIRIKVPGREPVTMAEATIEDHQAYVDYLSKMRGGIARTIKLHEEAIEKIRTAGVRCLAELELELQPA